MCIQKVLQDQFNFQCVHFAGPGFWRLLLYTADSRQAEERHLLSVVFGGQHNAPYWWQGRALMVHQPLPRQCLQRLSFIFQVANWLPNQ